MKTIKKLVIHLMIALMLLGPFSTIGSAITNEPTTITVEAKKKKKSKKKKKAKKKKKSKKKMKSKKKKKKMYIDCDGSVKYR